MTLSSSKSQGWYDTSSHAPFDFSQVYGLASSLVNSYNTVRETMVQQYLDAARPITPSTLMGIMRSHFEGSQYDLSNNYAISPNNYAATIYKARAAWGPFEARELHMQPAFERLALAVYRCDPRAGRALLTAYSGSLGMQAYQQAQTLLQQLDQGAATN